MSALEVLQTFPVQRKALLLAIGGIDPQDSMLSIFDMEKAKPRLSHQLAFQVQVVSKGRPIHRTIIDEGASTCVMSQACWLNLGSPTLTPPSNSLKAFDGQTFLPKGYLASFPITLSGKMVNVDVEVVECHLYYNLLLGRSWSYAMTAIVSPVFRLILFPLDGKIVVVDHLSFCTPDYATLPSSIVPLIGGFPDSYVSIGTSLLKASSLLGFFPLPPPQILNMVAMISTTLDGSIDPWIIPHLQTLIPAEIRCCCHRPSCLTKPSKSHLNPPLLWFRPKVQTSYPSQFSLRISSMKSCLQTKLFKRSCL